MPLESHKVPYELMIRFCPHPNRGKVGSILTYQFVEAVETVDTDTGEQVAYVPSPPVDLTPEQAQKYLGSETATFLDGLTAERAEKDAAQQKASDDLTALQAKLDDALKVAAAEKEQALAEQKATSDKQIADLKAANDALAKRLAVYDALDGGTPALDALAQARKQQAAQDAFTAAVKAAQDAKIDVASAVQAQAVAADVALVAEPAEIVKP